MSYELAAYEPGHRADYLRLLGDAWGDRALTAERFDWWFDGNPAGSLRSVALAGDRVVGVAGHSFFRMVLGGEERLATFSVHAVTDRDFRGRGIFVELERKHEREAQERGAAVVLAFASAPTAPLFLGPLGWTEIARYRVWARPFPRRAPDEPQRNPRPTPDGDAGRHWPNHVIRDAAYLRWRYDESPLEYRRLGDDVAYAVVGEKRQRGRPVGYVADLAGDEGRTRSLLRSAGRRVSGVAMLSLPSRGQRAAHASLGFFPIPWTLHFMGKGLAGELHADPDAWRFTLGDTDFF